MRKKQIDFDKFEYALELGIYEPTPLPIGDIDKLVKKAKRNLKQIDKMLAKREIKKKLLTGQKDKRR